MVVLGSFSFKIPPVMLFFTIDRIFEGGLMFSFFVPTRSHIMYETSIMLLFFLFGKL